MCLCFGCGGVGGVDCVGEQWLVGLDQGLEGWWCYVCVRCESGLSVKMAGPGIDIADIINYAKSDGIKLSIYIKKSILIELVMSIYLSFESILTR